MCLFGKFKSQKKMTDECEKTTKFELDEKSTAESHGNREQILTPWGRDREGQTPGLT